MKQKRRYIGGLCFSALGGLSVLGLCRALAPWLGFTLRLNAPAFLVAGVLGLPGAAGLLLLRWLLLVAA